MPLASDYYVFTQASASNVAASATTTTLVRGNQQRKCCMVFNDSPAILFLNISTGNATSANYSVQVPAYSLFETPVPAPSGSYTGFWTLATGSAIVTDIT